MSRLRQETIDVLFKTARSLNLERHVLLSGVPNTFVASLTSHSSPANQLLSDLHALNEAGTLTNNSHPLRTWLKNARNLSELRTEQGVFILALELLDGFNKPVPSLGATTGKGIEIIKEASVDVVWVTGFADVPSLYSYVCRRIAGAQLSIDDLTWGREAETDRTWQDKQSYREYLGAIKRAAHKSNPSPVFYREVMDISGEHRARAKEFLEAQLDNHSMRKPAVEARKLPLLSFMVVDGSEVIFAFHQTPSTREKPTDEIAIATWHPRIVSVFQRYFNQIWENSIPISKQEVGAEST